MGNWEYNVVPTPRRPKKAKGIKGNPARFANALAEAINEQAALGWEFVKTETLPMEAKPGLFKARVEMFQSVMVFRRAIGQEAAHTMEMPGVLTASTAGLTANRMVPELPEAAEPVTTLADTTEPDAEPAADPKVEPEAERETSLSFDADNMDPLKRVVEANRSGS